MCVLPDHEILACVSSGEIVISNFNESSLTPNGYDLSIAEILHTGERPKSALGSGQGAPQDHVLCQHWRKSGATRQVLCTALVKDIVDQKRYHRRSWKGRCWISRFAHLHGVQRFEPGRKIPIGARFVQIVFETMHAPPLLTYEKRSGHYQGQSGITLDPVNKKDVN